jgi:hypothetical protein
LPCAQTDLGCLHFYGLHVSKEVLWNCPGGFQARRVSVYLQNSLRLDADAGGAAPGEVAVALCGDPRSLLAVLSSGRLAAFSWQGTLRGASHPLAAAADAARPGRPHRLRRSSTSQSGTSPSPGSGSGILSRSSTLSEGDEPGRAAALALGTLPPLPHADSLPQEPAGEASVRAAHYSPAASLLALVLRDGRAALVQLPPQGGLAGAEHAHLLRWIYAPRGPSTGAVAAALQPGGHHLALGLAHGRVALYSVPALLTQRREPRGGAAPPPPPTPADAGALPQPARVLSLSEWGYSSAALGAAHALEWSPDGRVVAVGYTRRGMAVWTPSGCRVMCSLRQAAHGGAHAGRVPTTSTEPATPLGSGLGGGSRAPSLDGEPPALLGGGAGPAGLYSPSMLNPQHQPSAAPAVLEVRCPARVGMLARARKHAGRWRCVAAGPVR